MKNLNLLLQKNLVFINKHNLKSINVIKRIGNKSAYGNVYELETVTTSNQVHTNKYALKEFLFKETERSSTKKLENIFHKELYIGLDPELWKQQIGPSVIGYMFFPGKSGYLLMNHLEDGEKNVTLKTMSSLKNKFNKSRNVNEYNNILKKLLETLLKFYNLKNGIHGDLHQGNIMFKVDQTTLDVKKCYIIDYGAYIPTPYKILQNPYLPLHLIPNSNIKTILIQYRNLFKNLKRTFDIIKPITSTRYPPFSTIPKYQENGKPTIQSFRNNTFMLKSLLYNYFRINNNTLNKL